ncbi:YaaC family protein [Streptomyces sp. NPDC101234]|uniref:YaaC family protein n=1 Tax=Streptomyces sp. NPDC101234 TaxID=3366138 RepID=UPI0038175C18
MTETETAGDHLYGPGREQCGRQTDGTTEIRLGLRHCRTSLTDRTQLRESVSRRRTFSAALQQFEEQMKAAEVVSPATRPINLYYGLVQAGLAI